MHRIDGADIDPNANGLGKAGFHRGDPVSGREATEITENFMNAIQEEICNVIEESGITLDKKKNNQFSYALKKMFLGVREGATIAQLNKVIPAGAVAFFATHTAPEGWLKANGAAISRLAYADLFSAIGTTFGSGNGDTTFNLPDFRGEFLRGWDDGRGIDNGRNLGAWQAPSLITASIGPDVMQSIVVEGHHGNSATAIEFNSAMQTDNIIDAHYGSALKGHMYDLSGGPAYTGNSAGKSVDANCNRPLNHNNHFTAGGARPRNVALLACIKY